MENIEYNENETVEEIKQVEVKGENIDETEGVDFDPETQKITSYKIVTINENGENISQIIKKIEDKTAEEIEEEKKVKEETAILEKIKELKYKVALGLATQEEKEDLKLLI
jgi:MinD-like ATPase involved in chromosome partitioning or flagellar assembly